MREAHPRDAVRGATLDALTEEGDLALHRLQQLRHPRHRLEARRLPGAVAADHRDNLALVHIEVDARQRAHGAVLDGELPHRQEGGRCVVPDVGKLGHDRGERARAGDRLGLIAEVRGDHERVALHLLGCAPRDRLARLEHGDDVRNAHHDLHAVLDEQHRDARVADSPDELDERLGLGRVHPGRGLVEHEEVGIRGQRAGDLETPLVRVRQRAGEVAFVPGEPDERQEPAGALADAPLLGAQRGRQQQRACQVHPGAAVQADHDVVEHGHSSPQLHVLERARDPATTAPCAS